MVNAVVNVRAQPLLLKAWQAKAGCTAGILTYYVIGYFGLNRLSFEYYHDVPAVPFLDDLPLIPWTVLVYNSVFVLGALGIWLLPDARSVRSYFLSALFAYSINYLIFALFPTRIDRTPLPEGDSIWLWGLRLVRAADAPYTCFPSLHITNCTLAVVAHWGTRYGWPFLAWTVAIALTTLTTDQHLFLDLPAGAVVGVLGVLVARRTIAALESPR